MSPSRPLPFRAVKISSRLRAVIDDAPLLDAETETRLLSQVREGSVANTLLMSEDLTAAERRRLGEVRRVGEVARDRLVCANLRLVLGVVREFYARESLTDEDLVQEGVIGLLCAITRFDPAFGVRLGTYATYWIRQSVSRARERHDRIVRLPVRYEQRLREHRRLVAQGGVGILGPGEERNLEARLERTYSLDHPEFGVDGVGPDAGADDAFDDVATRVDVQRALASLGAQERRVLTARYGIDGGGARTLGEAARQCVMSVDAVRNREASAIGKLLHPSMSGRLGAVDDELGSS